MMTPQELASELKVPLASVYQWNAKGTGPQRIKVGKHIRYREADVKKWLQDHSAGNDAA